MRKRRLRPEEEELWTHVARSTKPLKKSSPLALASRTQPGITTNKTPDQTEPTPRSSEPIEPFRVGERAETRHAGHRQVSSLATGAASVPVHMDRKAFGKLKRGKLKPEARIDLHGMTMDQAHPALTRFVLNAQNEGKRLILVITGKGKPTEDYGPIPYRTGVLRHNVPHWLRSGALASAVLQISESHIKHGGRGAFYVYLRKRR